MEALQIYASDSESSESESSLGATHKKPCLADIREAHDDKECHNFKPSFEDHPKHSESAELLASHEDPRAFPSSLNHNDKEQTTENHQIASGHYQMASRSSYSSLPPPPADLLNSFSSAALPGSADVHGGRIRSFPHVEGNYALHVYIPVPLSSTATRRLEPLIKKASTLAPELESLEIDMPPHPAHVKRKDSFHGLKLAKEYHISLSRTVPIRIHQIDSIVPMLRHKFASQKRYWLEFGRWEFFVNDDRTRSFLALEIIDKGSFEIRRQIQSVNDVFRLHNLPTFYENPRPHISIAWALGNVMPSLKNAVEELNKLSFANDCKTPIWAYPFSKIECKIGNQTYSIWKATRQPEAVP